MCRFCHGDQLGRCGDQLGREKLLYDTNTLHWTGKTIPTAGVGSGVIATVDMPYVDCLADELNPTCHDWVHRGRPVVVWTPCSGHSPASWKSPPPPFHLLMKASRNPHWWDGQLEYIRRTVAMYIIFVRISYTYNRESKSHQLFLHHVISLGFTSWSHQLAVYYGGGTFPTSIYHINVED